MSHSLLSLPFWMAALGLAVFYRLLAPRMPSIYMPVTLSVISIILIMGFFGGSSFLLPLMIWVSVTVGLAAFIHHLPIAYRQTAYWVALAFVVTAMVLLKYPGYAHALLGDYAPATALGWLGLSFLAFRSIDLMALCRSSRLQRLSIPQAVAYLLYLPSFVSGPVNRFSNFIQDMKSAPTKLSNEELQDIALSISIGVIKSIFLANFALYYSILYVPVTSSDVSIAQVLVGLYFYYIYIYIDFSGYSDIAIGLSRLFGVRLPQNFNFPFLATSIQDFWNRWHISLSHWFRDHVFFPLLRTISLKLPSFPGVIGAPVSIFFTFLLVGAWHGDGTNWLLYGCYHGIGLAVWSVWSQTLNRHCPAFYERLTSYIPYKIFCAIVTFNYVSLGLILTLEKQKIDAIKVLFMG